VSSKKKLLIVYETMGTGHLRMANILEDMLGDESVEIVKETGSVLSRSTGADLAVNLWNYMLKKNWIHLLDSLVNFTLRILMLPISEVGSTASMMDSLDKIAPEIIICTSDCYNKILGQYAFEHDIPFYTVITDIAIFIDLVSVHSTHIVYFPETAQAIRSYDFKLAFYNCAINQSTSLGQKVSYVLKYYRDFVLLGYKNSIYRNPNRRLAVENQASCQVIGPLAERKHFQKKDASRLKESYGIPTDRPTVLVVSGGNGGGFVMDMVQVICNDYHLPINLLAMCGHDQALLNRLVEMKDQYHDVNIIPTGFTDHFDEFLAMSDCLVFRPSAGIFMESLLNRTPSVVIAPALTNDAGTLMIMEKHGTGEICQGKDGLAACMDKVLENNQFYRDNIQKLMKDYPQSYDQSKIYLRQLILGPEQASAEISS
jgi:hypothetical protein